MKRKILIFTVICIAILLCGCGKVDITCRITDDNVAMMEMKVEVPEGDLSDKDINSMRTSIHKIYNYWTQYGLEVEEDLYSDPIVLIGRFQKQTKDEKEAYDALLGFMKDAMSPFVEVEGGFSPAFFSDKRYLKAKIDLSHVVSSETLDALPQSQRQSIIDKIDNIDGRVSFEIPGDVIDSIGEKDDNVVYKDINFDDEMTLMVTTEYNNTKNINEYKELDEASAGQKKKVIIWAVVFGAILLLAIFSVILLYCTIKA